MNIEKITQGKNLTDTERTVLEYILDHLDTVQTEGVRDKIKTAQENGVCTVAITGEQENSVGRYADLWFRVENQWKLDDQNTMPNTFFPQVMMLIELITYEYRRLCMENGIK